MLKFLDGVHSEKCCGSLMGWAGRANVGRPFAIEHLKCAVRFSMKTWGKEATNVSYCSFLFEEYPQPIMSKVTSMSRTRDKYSLRSCRIESMEASLSNGMQPE